MSGDARNAFFFQCGDEQLFAVSLDKTGLNIPRSTCTQGWVLREEFLLGVQEPVPAAISPEPITRGRGPWSSSLTAKSAQRHGARAPSP